MLDFVPFIIVSFPSDIPNLKLLFIFKIFRALAIVLLSQYLYVVFLPRQNLKPYEEIQPSETEWSDWKECMSSVILEMYL